MSLASSRRTVLLRAAAGMAAAAVLCLGLAGCRPEPATTPSPNASSSSPLAAASTPTATPTETAQAGDEIVLPAACERLYSPAMLAALQAKGPLNDPGVTMTSTQNVDALEVLANGAPTIRCSWGTPGESGMATNVTIVDTAQSAALATALANAGFACAPELGGTVCRLAQSMITQDDEIAELTETHVLRGNAWVSSYTINFDVDGYTQDVVATLWG